jgi:hypothetical protein
VSDYLSRVRFELQLFRKNPKEWLLLTGDRVLVSLLGVVGLGIIFAAVLFARLVPLQKETPVLFLLFALIAANFTLIAIVTSLSQFVLGRRLESPGEIRQMVDETIAYREDVGATIGQTLMPVKPDAFFMTLYQNARRNLDALEEVTAETRTKRTRDELVDLISALRTHTDYVISLLDKPSSDMKHALFVSLNTSYEIHVHRAWYLETEYADEFTEEVTVPLTSLTETLEHIVVASRIFKTSFIESEISELSRFLLYVGLPVQIAAVVVMLLYTRPGTAPPLASGTLSILIPAVVVGGFTPFFILTSYVVRLTVVARRTADAFPFSSQLRDTLAFRDEFTRDS